MRFRIMLSGAFLLTAVLLATNAQQMFWFNKSSDVTSSIHIKSQELADAEKRPLTNGNRYARALATRISQDRINSVLRTSLPQDSCVEVFDSNKNVFASDPLVSFNADDKLAPASTNKLFTSAVVLTTLDPNSTLNTDLIASKKASSLSQAYVRTSGDPSFVTSLVPPSRRKPYFSPTKVHTFDDFAKKIYDAGVRSIGTLTIDTSWWDLPAVEPGWSDDKLQVGQISAFNVDEGFDGTSLVSSPRQRAADVLGAALTAKGITATTITFGNIPDNVSSGHEIATTTSASVKDLISDMLKTSDNVWAEQLLAAAVHKDSGKVTAASRAAFVAKKLPELGITTDNYVFKNGSGYSHDARATCSMELDAVKVMNTKGIDLTALSSVASVSGTLTDRFGTLDKSLTAKTGTLDGVTALTGTFNKEFVFSMIANGSFSDSVGHTYQESVVNVLNGFPFVRDPTFPSPS